MPQVCHAHCPKEGGGWDLIVVAAFAVALGSGVLAVVSAVMLPVLVFAWSLCAVGAAAFVWRLRVDGPMWKPGVPVRAAEPAPVRATPVPAALPVRPRTAVTGVRVIPGEIIRDQEVAAVPVRRRSARG